LRIVNVLAELPQAYGVLYFIKLKDVLRRTELKLKHCPCGQLKPFVMPIYCNETKKIIC